MNEDSPKATGPALLVQTFIFAENHLLLMQRGLAPYCGKWSPPGGFVEAFESAELAAIRETREEVGLHLDIEKLLPLATVSIESMNQLYLMFIVCLDSRQTLMPAPPEAIDARWVPESDFPMSDLWEPFSGFDMTLLFARARLGRFEYYQRTDRFIRRLSEFDRITYLRGGKLRTR